MQKTQTAPAAQSPAAQAGWLPYFDALRAAASLAVILSHTAALAWGKVGLETSAWKAVAFYDAAGRWSVPVFVMISGALFLGGRQTMQSIWRRHIPRLAAAYLFWGLVYALINALQNGEGLTYIIACVILGPTHFWFLPMLACLYMLVPLLRKITGCEPLLRYFLALGLVFGVVLPRCQALLPFFSEKAAYYAGYLIGLTQFGFAKGYVLYFVLGYFLHRAAAGPRLRRAVGLLGAAGLLGSFVFTDLASRRMQMPTELFYDNFSLCVLLTSAAAFCLFRWYFEGRQLSARGAALLRRLSRCSFGAYLVHQMVLLQLDRLLGLTPLTFHPAAAVPVLWGITAVLSFGIAALISHIPVLRAIA